MDAPKREVSFLETFPPDIWAYISCYLPGEQLARLMMTGATSLRTLLMSHGVVRSINLGKDFILFYSCPGFLNDFPSIDELLISSHSRSWSVELGLRLDLIPSGVRKLAFTVQSDQDTCFTSAELFGDDNATLKLNEYLPRLEVLNLWGLEISNFSWMSHAPPSLTKLTLSYWDGITELPSSLQYFEVDNVPLDVLTVSELPPFLESFVVNSSFGAAHLIMPLLPASTRTLSIPGFEDDALQDPQDFLESIPKFLTYLDIEEAYYLNFETNPGLISLLPRTLTKLGITHVPVSAWPLLPQELTSLEMELPPVMEEAQKNETFPFDSLPRSLTSLAIYSCSAETHFCGHSTTRNQFFFPPRLTSLTIPNVQLSPHITKLLPSSLTHLEIGNLCQRVCEQLPAGLKVLRSWSVLFSRTLIKFLPRSLERLRLYASCADHDWYDPKTGQSIGGASNHPQYAMHKACSHHKIDWKAAVLPPELIYLRLDHFKGLADSLLVHQRLPNLLTLKLSSGKNFTDALIPCLSPHLTKLNLHSSDKISGGSFKFLPRGLTHLDLSRSQSIQDSDIQHLPQTLKVAELGHATQLTDECIPHLPPHLRKLGLQLNVQITLASLPSLPYPILSSDPSCTAKFANWSITAGVLKEMNSNNLDSDLDEF